LYVFSHETRDISEQKKR